MAARGCGIRCSVAVALAVALASAPATLSPSAAQAATPAVPSTAPVPAPWQAPLDAPLTVTRPFAAPASRYGTGHRGVDLAGTPGAVVAAAGAGIVTYAGLLAGRGVVTITHNGGLRTTYEPIEWTVHVGQAVTAGQEIGLLTAGHPGCPVAACLHWGLIRGSDYLDPMRLVGGGPVRLLPFWDGAGRVPAANQPGRTLLPARPRAVVPVATPRAIAAAVPDPATTTSPGAQHSTVELLGAGGGTGGLLLVAGLAAGRRRHRRRTAPT